MYRSFTLDLDEEIRKALLNDSDTVETGRQLMKATMQKYRPSIQRLVLPNNTIDVTKIEDGWFPVDEYDVFLSHSHADENYVLAIATVLEEHFDLRTFVDSSIWGHSDDILQQFDDRYCRDDDDTIYLYPKRNLSTSHFHMILSAALTKVMDQCEAVMFVRTTNSVATSSVVDPKTYSPWIYAELNALHVMRQQAPSRMVQLLEKSGVTKDSLFSRENAASRFPKFEYPIPKLTTISSNGFVEWVHRKEELSDKHALDILYEIMTK